jgi:hypothetical protein
MSMAVHLIPSKIMFSLRLNCALSSAKFITKAHASHNTLKNICSFYFHACRLEYAGAKILLLFTPISVSKVSCCCCS